MLRRTANPGCNIIFRVVQDKRLKKRVRAMPVATTGDVTSGLPKPNEGIKLRTGPGAADSQPSLERLPATGSTFPKGTFSK